MMMIEMLIQMPDLRRRIQADHVADSTGHCRDCGSAQWPCELYKLATEADRRCAPTGARPVQLPVAAPVSRPISRPAPRQVAAPMSGAIAGPAMSQLPTAPATPPAWTGHRVPPQSRPAQLPPQRVPAYEPVAPMSGRGTWPTPADSYRQPRPRPLEAADDLPLPRGNNDQPRHLIGLPRQPAPKQELIDVLEDVLRWSR
jgi:hypothetical protein